MISQLPAPFSLAFLPHPAPLPKPVTKPPGGPALLLLLALVGCGEVVAVPVDVGPAAATPSESPAVTGPVDGNVSADAEKGPDGGERPATTTCTNPADGCDRCANAATVDGGAPFQSAAQCRAVIDCVRAGNVGEYPWQSCLNLAGAETDLGGSFCAQALVKECGK